MLRQAGYDHQVDVWSLGVITFIVLCGYPPFYADNDAALYQMILKGEFEFIEEYWGHISFEAMDLIEKMLHVDPVHRITTAQILAHPWISGEAKFSDVNLSRSVSLNLQQQQRPS